MKQLKIPFLIVLSLSILVLASCVPGGTQPAQGWSGVTFDEGLLYVGSMDSKVVAINPSTRNPEWSYVIPGPSRAMSCGQTSAPSAMYGTATVDNDMVYIGLYDGEVLALNATARSQGLPFPQKRDREWSYPETNESIGGIVGGLVINENAIYVTSSDGKVYSLDKGLGDLNWQSDVLGEKLWTTPLVRENAIYVSTFDGHIYSLATEDGSLLPWAFKVDVGFCSSLAIYEDILFVGAFDNNLYAIEIGGSKPLWTFSGGKWFWATPMVKDGVVYAGCLDSNVYAIDARTGQELWRFHAGSPIVSSPVLNGDLLVVASESGSIYVFDTNAGQSDGALSPVKTVSINALVRGSICVQGNMVYVRAQDNWLYALDIDKGWVSWKLPLTTK